MRRAAFSVPSNIAEGCGRAGLDYFLLLARDLQFLTPRQYDALEVRIHEITLMLAGLIGRVSAKKTLPTEVIPNSPQ
jgi:hypothetical protein